MPATIKSPALLTHVSLAVPAVVSASANGTGVDVRDYEGLATVLINTGAQSGSGILNWKLEDSADNSTFAAVTSFGGLGTGFTPNSVGANQTLKYDFELDSVRRYIRIVTTLVSGTSLACNVSLACLKKVSG